MRTIAAIAVAFMGMSAASFGIVAFVGRYSPLVSWQTAFVLCVGGVSFFAARAYLK